MFSELNAKRRSGLVSHTIGQVVKLPQWWWESAQFTSMLKWVAVPAELQHWEVEQEGAVSTCSQYLHCAVQTIYLQIATAGGQQLFGRVGGANINYLKQQICVSNTFTKNPQLSILSISVKLDTKE